MASGAEIKGSRKTWTRARESFAQVLRVSDDGTTDVPAIGDAFPGDAGATLTKRVAVKKTSDPEVIPGAWYHVITYNILRAYA